MPRKTPEKMEDQGQLDESVARVKALCFPSWPRKQKWNFIAGYFSRETSNRDGQCDPESRIIFINPTVVKGTRIDLELVIAHEICHAIAGQGHGNPWLRRMRKAAEAAERNGHKNLAGKLRKEVSNYKNEPQVSHAMVYSVMHDIVWETQGKTSFKGILRHLVGEGYGNSADDLLRLYPRLYEEFENAIGIVT